jgi:protein gp37
MSRTSIEWATDSWNPIAFYVPDENGGEKRGWMCTKPSEGCAHCYAAAMNLYRGNGLPYVVSSLDKGEFRLVNIDDPLHWRKPRQVFVCSMTDLFHESIPTPMIDEVIARIAVLALWDRPHIMIVLTKRARRQRDYFNDPGLRERIARVVGRATQAVDAAVAVMSRLAWPLENLWVGCTAENQARLDERMPDLAATLAAHRFLSCEPLLSALEFTPPEHRGTNVNVNDWLGDLDWVVAGGESGAGARPMRSEWVRGIGWSTSPSPISSAAPAAAPSARAKAGLRVRMAMNHWELAVETHNTNFPDTDHDCCDISASDPRRYPSTDILITSPECTTHSPAGGNRRARRSAICSPDA